MFYSNGLGIWHGLPDIKVNNGRKSAILNFITLKFVGTYPFLKPHILFYSNGLAIWHGFPNILILKSILAFFKGISPI